MTRCELTDFTRLIDVPSITEMLKLTVRDVKKGDVICVGGHDIFVVVDTTKLSSLDGYAVMEESRLPIL